MSENVPVIYSVPHASHSYGMLQNRSALLDEQRYRFSDYGTDKTVPLHGKTLIAEYSRALANLNRAPDDPLIFPDTDYGKPHVNKIWIEGKELTRGEKEQHFKNIYLEYHRKLENLITSSTTPLLVVDWHNTAHYEIGIDDSGSKQIMKPIILSNQGQEGFAEGEQITCDPQLLYLTKDILQTELQKLGLPNEVYLNHIYKGGYITRHYNTILNPSLHIFPVQSFQVEYDTIITHDQKTLQEHTQGITKLREAFTTTISRVLSEYSLKSFVKNQS